MYVIKDELDLWEEKFAKILQNLLSKRSDPDKDPVQIFLIWSRPGLKVPYL
jgi:hypothetical protein